MVQAWLPNVGDNILNPATGSVYRIGGNLGKGGFGLVHECTDVLGRVYAAKYARPEGVVADVEKRWMDECQLMLSVSSPYIIRLHDYFMYRNVFWMIMERADCTLKTRIEINGRLDDQNTVLAGLHILSALQEMNNKGIVHRDLHIDNILWSSRAGENSLKIADFGIAKRLLSAGAVATTRIGRHYDIAPDLHLDGYTTHQSDLYQLGLAMYFVHTGAEALGPADGPPKYAILSGVARERAESLRTPIGDYIAVLLRRRAEYRYQHALRATAELAAIAPLYGVKV